MVVSREVWAVIHGFVFGSLFMLAFVGALAGLWSLRPGTVTSVGLQQRAKQLIIGLGATAVSAWGTVITGTWIVYPWYREKLAGENLTACAGLDQPSSVCSARDFLLSNASGQTQQWHEFGMEWKEHVAWGAPFLATSAFLLGLYYGPRIIARPWLRTVITVLLVAAFAAAAVAGLLGLVITSLAPI